LGEREKRETREKTEKTEKREKRKRDRERENRERESIQACIKIPYIYIFVRTYIYTHRYNQASTLQNP
jgi:hypothetical protein